ncbi:hypothetical protein SLA2020_286690 [Shorea laevis]
MARNKKRRPSPLLSDGRMRCLCQEVLDTVEGGDDMIAMKLIELVLSDHNSNDGIVHYTKAQMHCIIATRSATSISRKRQTLLGKLQWPLEVNIVREVVRQGVVPVSKTQGERLQRTSTRMRALFGHARRSQPLKR